MPMLRPATPLTLIFLVAFVLLLLSTLSTPIIKGIPLASYQGYDFGVFGWCKEGKCSPVQIGYSTDGLFSGNSADDFSLPASARHSLSSILIVHPVATFLTLICLCLGAASHFHSPSSSPRYLLALLILTVPTLLVTLLAFLVDILLFVPHMQWGGWIVLAATILIIASSVVTCAMRRTLVSRKARKKRIAENAEMSGANYYENMAQSRGITMTQDSSLPRADSPPPMSGSTAVDKGMPQFASFAVKAEGQSRDGTEGGQDDRTPLNPSIRSGSSTGRRQYIDAQDAPPMPYAGRPSMDSQGRPRRPSRDQYGNPLAPGEIAALRSQRSDGSLGSRGRGRPGYGGPPPPGRGFPPSPRGSYGPQSRGGYGPRGGYRGGQPPPGWNARGRGGYGPPQGIRGPPPPQARPGPPPGYGNDAYFAGAVAPLPRSRSGPSPTMEHPQADAAYVAGPIGQAVEMNEHTGSPGPSSPTGVYDNQPNYGLRDSDADVSGMVGLQHDRGDIPAPVRQESYGSQSGMRSPTSIYSGDQPYMPPRAQWAQPEPLQQQQQRGYTTSPLASGAIMDSSSSNMPSSTVLPTSQALSPIQASPRSPQNRHKRSASEPYYEDIDPRFAVEEPSDDGFRDTGVIPDALTPGGMPPGSIRGLPGGYPATPGAHQQQQQYGYRMPPPNPDYLHAKYGGNARGGVANDSNSDPSLDPSQRASGGSAGGGSVDGASERASEASHFTSISERPVNPNWRPGSAQGGPGSAYAGGGPPPSSAAAVQRRRDDMILGGNPDFSLPGTRGAGPRGAPGGPRGGAPVAASAVGMGGGVMPGGRYPTEF